MGDQDMVIEQDDEKRKNLTSFPGAKVSSHEQIIKTRHANELQEFRDDLLDDEFFHEITSQALPDLVQQVENVVHAKGRL